MEIFSFYFDNFNKKCYNFIIKDKKYKEFWAKYNKFSFKFLCNMPIDKLLIMCYTIITKGQRRQKKWNFFLFLLWLSLAAARLCISWTPFLASLRAETLLIFWRQLLNFFLLFMYSGTWGRFNLHPTGLELVMGDASIIICGVSRRPGRGYC